ncbi:MAG: EamA family transporter [Coriobacteriales bacterium]|nr:EamA family transporter [Coriobacteriales bacterium]
MPETSLFLLVMVLSVFVSSFSQILLKVSAGKTYTSRINEYLNPWVVGAYLLTFCSTVVTVVAYRYVALSMGPVIESLGYVFIALLSYLILKEKISGKKMIGLGLIVCGVLVVVI